MFKKSLALKDSTFLENSEFLLILSREKLSYPRAELFEICCILLCYYKNVEKNCINPVVDPVEKSPGRNGLFIIITTTTISSIIFIVVIMIAVIITIIVIVIIILSLLLLSLLLLLLLLLL